MQLKEWLEGKYPAKPAKSVKPKQVKKPKKKVVKPKPKRKRCLSIDQVAEAFELHTKGVYYCNIAVLLGVSELTLRRYMKAAERYGFAFWGDDYVYSRNGTEKHGAK